jgi:TATA-box binding protein (TBP) (component of TFIID and TFIIIB)
LTRSPDERKFVSVRPCGRDLFELIPRSDTRIDLASASKALRSAGYNITDISEMALTAGGPNEVSIFPNGKMIVFPAKSNEEAEDIGRKILDIISRG